ncbi:hypothetical protein ACOCJ4_07385 [Knoellia sp. CPCC 206435]|uniref:hypothetical protein n=1 Tax=Knoellia terrae TaxID=3404797 RepID=UPI003B4340F5
MSLGSSPLWAITLGGALGAGYGALLTWAITTNEYNAWGSLLVLPVVILLNLVLIRACTRHEATRWLHTVMLAALAAKMLGSVARYLVAYIVYDRASDAERYNAYASDHYLLWRRGDIDWEMSLGAGTQNMERLTTALYAVTGPSPVVGFAVYSSLAFWGAFLLYRAFVVAFPTGNHRRYALLVFFLPSILYWPSSMGKEAWLLLFTGATALGAARLFTHRSGAFALLGAGAVGTALIRPHLSVLLFTGLFVAQLLRPTRRHATDVLAKLGGVAVMAVVALVLANASAEMLGIDDLSFVAISDGIDMASGRTTQGGSEFEATTIGAPLDLLVALVTVLARPFPWEAVNPQMLLQSFEGVFLIVLAFRSRARLRRLVPLLRSNAYLTFALVYSVAFVVAFAGFSNFGILARQRVLMLPFILILLALPLPEEDEPADPVGPRRDARALLPPRGR